MYSRRSFPTHLLPACLGRSGCLLLILVVVIVVVQRQVHVNTQRLARLSRVSLLLLLLLARDGGGLGRGVRSSVEELVLVC